MTVEKKCEWCGFLVQAPDAQGGKHMDCPECSSQILLPPAPPADPNKPATPADEELDWVDDEDLFSVPEEENRTKPGTRAPLVCPMCGEGNSQSASRCASCGEPLGNRVPHESVDGRPYLSPKYVKLYRKHMHGVGWVLIIFGLILFGVGLTIAFEPNVRGDRLPNSIFGMIYVCGGLYLLGVGPMILQKNNGAVLAGLIFLYVWVALLLVAAFTTSVVLLPGLLFFAVLIEAHQARKMAKEILRAGYPLTIKPEDLVAQGAGR